MCLRKEIGLSGEDRRTPGGKMKDLDSEKKIAVLIDADNARHSKLKLILAEISAHGHMIVKRAYGDWSSDTLKNWKTSLNELAIQPIQQFAYTTGKNSTDASMIIDAMDLLYSDKFDAFAIVSSDSDFTKLASRLKESEIFVFGVGEKKTPISFRNACDDFIYVENLDKMELEKPAAVAVPAATTTAQSKSRRTVTKQKKKPPVKGPEATVDTVAIQGDFKELIFLINKAWELYQDDEGWANVAAAGSFIKRSQPDFDPRSYNAKKLPDIIENLKDQFTIKKFSGKGGVNIVAYKPL